jgi:hypothetical protein
MSFGNFYLCNPVERWAAVCISKNACTSLKAGVLQSLGRAVPETTNGIHDLVGYQESELLRPVSAGPPPGMTTFAVWRDPVDRWYSAVAYLRRPDELFPRRRILGTRNSVAIRVSLRQALAVTGRQLALDPLRCDEHLRRQSDYADFAALDHVVELRGLNAFFERNGWGSLPRRNEAVKPVARDERVSAEIRELYAADVRLPIASPA